MNDTVKLAIDAIQGKVTGNYTKDQTAETLRQALIEANGGSTKVNIKKFYRGHKVFEIIEEIIPYISHDGLTGNEFFMNWVDYRNLALGDENEFVSKGKNHFIVSNMADGILNIRRQRLDTGESTKIETFLRGTKIYSELNRLLAGRIDFFDFIKSVGEAMTKDKLDSIYLTFKGITKDTQGLSQDCIVTGSGDAQEILSLIQRIEAKTGKTAKIIGTNIALGLLPNVDCDESKSDKYNIGYYGKFYGTETFCIKQRFEQDGKKYIFDDSKIYIIAGDDKPIKFVDEGEGFLSTTDALQNNDGTQEYKVAEKYGVALMFNEEIGVYTFSK